MGSSLCNAGAPRPNQEWTSLSEILKSTWKQWEASCHQVGKRTDVLHLPKLDLLCKVKVHECNFELESLFLASVQLMRAHGGTYVSMRLATLTGGNKRLLEECRLLLSTPKIGLKVEILQGEASCEDTVCKGIHIKFVSCNWEYYSKLNLTTFCPAFSTKQRFQREDSATVMFVCLCCGYEPKLHCCSVVRTITG